jgi:hypothetical protein
MPSTQLFIVGPNSKIRTDVLRIDIMLSVEMGHQDQVIVYISRQLFRKGHDAWKEEEGAAGDR